MPLGLEATIIVSDNVLKSNVIGAADQGGRPHLAESERQRGGCQVVEDRGLHVRDDRKVIRGGTQVLAESNGGATGRAKVLKRRVKLLDGLPEPDHEAGLES